MAERLDERTRDRVFEFLCGYVDKHHFPPSLQEIADGVGLSKTSVYRIIEFLEARGKVKRTAGKARTVLPLR